MIRFKFLIEQVLNYSTIVDKYKLLLISYRVVSMSFRNNLNSKGLKLN